jgi:hypothetical protein
MGRRGVQTPAIVGVQDSVTLNRPKTAAEQSSWQSLEDRPQKVTLSVTSLVTSWQPDSGKSGGILHQYTRFGTEGSEVQILSPRPLKLEIPMRRPSNLEGFFHLYVDRWGKSGDTGASVASWMFSCHFGCHLQL